MTNSHPVICPGEPAGIGPDLLLLWLAQKPETTVSVVADGNLLEHRARALNLSFDADALNLLHLDCPKIDCCSEPTVDNAAYVLACLDKAIEGCLAKNFTALVTGPVQKSIINEAGIAFTGHTEYLALKTHSPKTVMCFENNLSRVALATTHIPLNAVPKSLTAELLVQVIEIIHNALINVFKIKKPRIGICGLNPHAGEGGFLGTEEIEIIKPVMQKLAKQQIQCEGPYPADTIYHQASFDCILSLYHDQLLPLVKFQSFFETVNITLGLPFIRTSVDHGTALKLAGTGNINALSLASAIKTARRLSF